MTGQQDVPGYILAEEGMRSTLEQSTDFEFEYFSEYMDRYRFTDVSYQQHLLDLYRTKYTDKNIDLIIAYGYHALDFAVTHADEIFPHIPIVFSAILETQLKRLTLDQRFTGCLLQIDYQGLLNTALNNHPDTQHVVIIGGNSKVSRLIDANVRATYAPYADTYDFLYLGKEPISELLDRLTTLPKHSVVIYYYLTLDGNGEAFQPWNVAAMVSEAANAPVYGMADTYLGHGIVGGTLLSYEAQGRKAAEIGLRVLKGENPTDIPISAEGTIQNMFDWRALKRWGIKESALPPGSIVRYKTPSIWDPYKWYIIVGIVVVFLQGFFIVSLLVQHTRGRQREQQLRASGERYRAFVKNSTEGIWCAEFEQPIDLDLPEDEQFELVYKYGYISEANDAYARHVGLEHGEELVGTRIEEFAPQSVAKNVESVKAWIRGRYTIIDAETVESYKDGTTRNILNNSVGFIEAGRVVRVWGTGRDMTAQREIEKGLRQSKEFNQAVLMSLTDQIAVLDRQGTILTVNESWLRFARDNELISPERISPGVSYLDVCRQASNAVEGTARSALEGIESIINGRHERFELEYPCHSPTEQRWFLMSVVPFKGRKGGVIVSHKNITDRKHAEAQLHQSEHKYRTVANFTHDWEYWKAQDGGFHYVSPSCERITGYTVSDFMDRPELLEEIVLPEDRSIWEHHKHERETVFDRHHRLCQFRVRAKDDSIQWIEHICRWVFDAEGNVSGLRASNRDITDLRLAENEAHEHRELLARVDRSATLGQLAGSLAHELNQPLTGILSNAQASELLLQQAEVDCSVIGESLTDIIADTKRASEVLRNVRDLFRQQQATFTVLRVNALITETLRLLHSEFVFQSITIHRNFSETLPEVRGNRVQFQQVLINLINNAAEAMCSLPAPERVLSITTRTGEQDEVQICVEDCGPGIDLVRLERLFEPLTTTKMEGLGLGLNISRSIVQAHGGRMWAENRREGGASVGFALPAVNEDSEQ